MFPIDGPRAAVPDVTPRQAPPAPADPDAPLREAARALEATFLAEMLKAAKFGEARQSLGGGAGEDQFGSFMVQAQAEAMVEAGGIGLAEALFEALKERQDGAV